MVHHFRKKKPLGPKSSSARLSAPGCHINGTEKERKFANTEKASREKLALKAIVSPELSDAIVYDFSVSSAFF